MSKNKKTVAKLVLLTLLLSLNSLFATNKKTVLFDENHDQFFLTGKTGELDLSSLSTLFEKEGWVIKTSKSEITDEVLTDVDALVISGAFKPITQPEIEAILRFVEKGGALSVMLHIGSPFDNLLHAMNVSVSSGTIHEQELMIGAHNIDFNVVNLKTHELTNNLKQFKVYGGWALFPNKENVQIVAQTSEKSWIDLNGDNHPDMQQAFATILEGKIGLGHFVVFSDDAIFQNKFLKDSNYLLGKNLAKWLAN